MTWGGWPMVGREAELDALRAALDAGRHVAVLGAPGVGKTRVVEAAADELAGRGVLVRRVVASPGDVSLVLAPFLGLLAGRRDEPLTTLLDGLGVGRGAEPPVLVVDDAHNLDVTSAALVHQLANLAPAPDGGRPVRVVLVARAGVELPDAVAAVVATEGTATVRPLPLDAAAAGAAVAGRLGGRLEPRSADRIVAVAHGNPLYLREIVEGALSTGALVDDAGLWRLRGELSATPVLDEVVLARLLDLDADERDALEVVAVGGELDLTVVGRVVPAAVLERLERAEHLRVRDLAGRTLLDVGHPLVRELLRERLPALGSLRLCRALAEATAAAVAAGELPDRPEVRVQVAAWSLRGGVEVTGEVLLEAALAAKDLGDTAIGGRLALAAAEVSPAAEPALVAAWCLGQQGDHDGAVAVVERYRPLVDDPWDRAAMDLRVAEEHWWGDQDTAAASSALAAGLDGAGEEAALLEAQRGVFAMLDGRIAEAAAIGRRYVDHERPWVRFIAGLALGQALAYADRGAEAADVAGRLHADLQADRADLLADLDLHVVGVQLGLLYDGRLEEALGIAALIDAGASARPDPQPRAWAAVLAGSGQLVAGDLEQALRRLLEAELLWVDCGLRGPARWCATGVALAAAGLGETATARAALGRMDAYPPDGFGLFEPLQRLAGTWVAVADHDEARAVVLADEATRMAAERGAWAFLAWIAHDLARLGLETAACAAADAVPSPRSPLAEVRIAYVRAVADGDAAGLEAVSGRFEAMGAALFAAEAQAGAARLARRAGDRRAALRGEGRTGVLLTRVAGATTPPLASRARQGPLSPRERQVAELAAAGHANKEIAARLVVSERTVENHLYRAFIKLGIGSRGELAAALADA